MGALVTIKPEKTEDMLTIKESAHILGAGASTVSRWVADGKLPACKVKGSKAYYILVDDLNDFEKYGNVRTRQKKHIKKERSSVEIINTMSEMQQGLLLEAVSSISKLLAITIDVDQIKTIKGVLNDTVNSDEFLSQIFKSAPELLEEFAV